MGKYLEDLLCLSHSYVDPPDIAATDRNVETQVTGEGVCVVGVCRGRGSWGVSRSGGRGPGRVHCRRGAAGVTKR